MSGSQISLACAVALGIAVVLPTVQRQPSAQAPGQSAPLQAGRKVFEDNCARCHGRTGRGDGPDSIKLGFHPRDFTLGAFKCRCTPTGQPPTDEDLMRSVAKGLPGTPMAPFEKTLGDADRAAVVQYVKSLSKAFNAGNLASCPAAPAAPARSPELVNEGRLLYEKMQCAMCHGKTGRGDGPSAAALKDDWGQPIKPYNFAALGRFKCGNDDADLFRTLQTGLTGAPMPSFGDALAFETDGMTDQARRDAVNRRTWALVQYLRSLSAK